MVVAVVLTKLPSGSSSHSERTYPQNAVEARRVIARAERDARAHPNDGEAQFAYALSLMWVGRKDEARPLLARSESLLPRWAWPPNALGWLLLNRGDYGDAIPHLERAISLDSSYSAAYHNLGWSLARLGRRQASEQLYARAVAHLPDEPDMAADYAFALFQDRKLSAAIGEIYRAIRLDSTVARYHDAAGYMLRSRGRFVEARKEFQRAVELDPAPAPRWMQLGMTDYLMGDARGADAAFTAAARRDSMLMKVPELHTMWVAAQKGRSVPVQAESMIEFHLDSAPTGH